jgi:hypothetical protein
VKAQELPAHQVSVEARRRMIGMATLIWKPETQEAKAAGFAVY